MLSNRAQVGPKRAHRRPHDLGLGSIARIRLGDRDQRLQLLFPESIHGGSHVKLNTHDQNAPENTPIPQSEVGDVFDFIVCGAGSSGSVVAARLAEDGNASVLLLEAGGDDAAETVIEPCAMAAQSRLEPGLGLCRTTGTWPGWSTSSSQHGQRAWWRFEHQRHGMGQRTQGRLGSLCR